MPRTLATNRSIASGRITAVNRVVRGAAPPDPLTVNLISHWFLEETGLADRIDTHDGHDLGPINSPGNAAGIFGNAVELLTASDQSLTSLANSIDFDPENGSYSMSGWARFYQDVTVGDDDERTVLSGAGATVAWTGVGGNIAFAPLEGAALTISAPDLDTWYFFTCGYNVVTGTNFLSVNGSARVTSPGLPESTGGPTGFTVGAPEGGGTANLMDGRVDSVSFWKGRALTPSEDLQLYNGGAGLDYPF